MKIDDLKEMILDSKSQAKIFGGQTKLRTRCSCAGGATTYEWDGWDAGPAV